MHEFPGTVNEYGNWMDPYDRKKPERFEGDSAEEGVVPVDKYTQNLLDNVAIEGKHGDKKEANFGTPTGSFYTTKEDAKQNALEVACTHFSLCADKGKDWLESPDPYAGISRFDAAWNHADVLSEGRVDAIGMTPFFMRTLFKPLGDVDLQ